MVGTLFSPSQVTLNTVAANGLPGKPITEIITNGFFKVDRKWTVTYWNKAAEKLLGIKATDILGKNLWEKFVDILPLDFYVVYHKAFLQDIPVHFEEYWGEMGAWFDVITYHCDDTLAVSFKSSKEPSHLDFSTQKGHPFQQLKVLTQLYQFVTEVTNDCLWEWDLQAKEIFWIDGGHKRVFGYPVANALIPQDFWESLIHPEDRERVVTRLNKIIEEGSTIVWEEEYKFRRISGEYACVHDRGHIIYDEEKKASRMIGATQDISEKVLLKLKLEAERLAQQKEITSAILTAQENERAEIGKELHDNLGQILAVTKLYIQMAQKPDINKNVYLKKCSAYLDNAMVSIRKIAKNLVIPDTHFISMIDNIKNLLYDLAAVNPIKITFEHKGIVEGRLDEKFQINIFRIVQEQLTNILKHSGATQAKINLSIQEDGITLRISDNGKGSNIDEKRNGVGLRNIMSRAELYHGKVDIQSKPGEGFELTVVLPPPQHNADSFELTDTAGVV